MREEPQDVSTDAIYAHWARNSSDEQLIEHLLNALFCAQHIEQPDPARLERGIVELFCEAVRRELDIPELVREPMLPDQALRAVTRGIDLKDPETVWNALPFLNASGLWTVFRRYRTLPLVGPSFLWLEEIAYHVERRLYSPAFARARCERRRGLGIAADEYTALLELTINGLFGSMLMSMELPQLTREEESEQ